MAGKGRRASAPAAAASSPQYGDGEDPAYEITGSGSILKREMRGIFDDALRNFTTDSDTELEEEQQMQRKSPFELATYDELQEGIAKGIMSRFGISRAVFKDMCTRWTPQTNGEIIQKDINAISTRWRNKQKRRFAHLFDPEMEEHPIDVYLDQQWNLLQRWKRRWFFGEMGEEEVERRLYTQSGRNEMIHEPLFVEEEVFRDRVAHMRKMWESDAGKKQLDSMQDPNGYKAREIARARRSFERERDIVNKQGVRNFLEHLKTMDPINRVMLMRTLQSRPGVWHKNFSGPIARALKPAHFELHDAIQMRYLKATMLRIPPPKNDLFKPVAAGDVRKTITQLNDYRNGGKAATDDHGRNVLHHFATKEINPDAIRILVSEGVPWAALDHQGNTILHYAAAYDRKKIVRAIRNIKGSHWLTMVRNDDGLLAMDIATHNGTNHNSLIARDRAALSLLDPNYKKASSAPEPHAKWVDALERLGFDRRLAATALRFTRNSLEIAYEILANFDAEKILEMGKRPPLPRAVCAQPPGPIFKSYELEYNLENLAVMYSSRLLENVTTIAPDERRKIGYSLYAKIKLRLQRKASARYHQSGERKDFPDYDVLRLIRVYMGWESAFDYVADDHEPDFYLDAQWLEQQPEYAYLCDDPNPHERVLRLRKGLKQSLMRRPPEILKAHVRRMWKALRNNRVEASAKAKMDGTDMRLLEKAVRRVAEVKAMPIVPRRIKEEAIDKVVDAYYPTVLQREFRRGFPFISGIKALLKQ